MTTNRIPEVEQLIEAVGGEERLFEFFPKLEDREQLLEEVAAISGWLSLCVDDPKRDRDYRKYAKKALVELSANLNGVRKAIDALEGHVKQRLVRKASGVNGRPGWRESGEEQIASFVESLKSYETWSREIRIGFNSAGGRPKRPEADGAMHRLVELWEEYTGKTPTIITDWHSGEKYGPFLRFCEIVIIPVYEAHALQPPKIHVLAQNILYPSDAER